MSSKVWNAYLYIRMRIDELGVLTIKTIQIGINGLLFISLRGDQKVKTQNSLQQYGLTSQKQLQQAQQISSSLQNHNFGSFYPEFIRAFITLYLVGLVIHLLHTQLMNIIQKKFVLQTFFGTVLMVFFHILDLMIVNDYLILNSEYSNLTQAVPDIYIDSNRKSKDMIQLFEAVIRQLVNINRFLSFFFQGQVFWTDGLRKLIKNKRKISGMQEVQSPPQQFLEQPINNQPQIKQSKNNQKKDQITHHSGKKKKTQEKPEQQQQQQRGESIEKRKKKQQEQPQQQQQQQQQQKKSQKSSPKEIQVEQKNEEPSSLFLSKQVSQVQKDDINNNSTQAGSNGSKSAFEHKTKSNRSESLPNRIYQKELNLQFQKNYSLDQRKKKEQQKKIRSSHDQLYKFHLQTNVDKYDIKAHSIQEMNNHLNRIATENFWNSFLSINVKLNYWKEAYQVNQSQEIKEELQRIIAQYALYLMNQHAQNQEIVE